MEDHQQNRLPQIPNDGTVDAYLKAIQEAAAKRPRVPFLHGIGQSTCPNCGYCPHCGRGGAYVPRPYGPEYWWR